jgi:CHAT domain-containing protein
MKTPLRPWILTGFVALFVLLDNPVSRANSTLPFPARLNLLSQSDPLAEGAELHQQVVQLYQQGKYQEAIPLMERSLQIRETQLGANHPDTATSLNNLAALYQGMGRYPEAEPLLQRSLQITETQLGANHPDTATSLNNLAGLYRAMGRYPEAEPLFQRSLQIRETQLGANHPLTATSLNSLALLYRDIGRYPEAEPLYQRSLQIRETQLGANHPLTANSLNNLAGLYQDMRRYPEAEPLFQRSLQITETQLGANHPDTASSLNNLAFLYRDIGRYPEAEPLYQRSLQIRETQLGANHPDTATSLNNLAGLYQDMGRYPEAEPLFQRSLQIYETQLGANHPRTATSLNNLAVLYQIQNQPERALPLLERAADIEESNLATLLAIGSESRKLSYINTLRGSTNGAIFFSIQQPQNPRFTRLALTTLLRRKGRVLDALTDSNRLIRQQLGNDPTLQQQLTDLQNLRTELTNFLSRGQGNQTPAAYQTRYNHLTQQIEQLENDLANRSSALRAENTPVTLAQVQALLPANAAFVEITRYLPFNLRATREQRWGAPRYAAYVLRSTGEPQVMDLGDAAAIDERVGQFRQLLSDRDSDLATLQQTARQLDAKLLEPLQAALGSSTHLLLSPDSSLNLIPFEALVNPQGQYRLQQYDLSYLTAGRDLVRLQLPAAPAQTSVIVADPDYNQAQPALVAANPTEERAVVRSSNTSGDLSNLSFSRLEATDREGQAVQSLLPNATLLTQTQATKDRILNLQNPLILHIATHGFFLPDAEVDLLPPAFSSTLNGDNAPRSVSIVEPLLRAGLALAGANVRDADQENNQTSGGILTAAEIAELSLFGTQLVVLSACETNVGEIRISEGVYGLRRALALAGARSQVTSLWRVNDAATADLMTDYYQRLRNGAGRHAALKQAQLTFLDGSDTARRHPYFWAGFIPSGEWRSMEFN